MAKKNEVTGQAEPDPNNSDQDTRWEDPIPTEVLKGNEVLASDMPPVNRDSEDYKAGMKAYGAKEPRDVQKSFDWLAGYDRAWLKDPNRE